MLYIAIAVVPYTSGSLSFDEALSIGLEPIREFMFSHTREKDLEMFIDMRGQERPAEGGR